jgi:hypothetical protein
VESSSSSPFRVGAMMANAEILLWTGCFQESVSWRLDRNEEHLGSFIQDYRLENDFVGITPQQERLWPVDFVSRQDSCSHDTDRVSYVCVHSYTE